VTNVGEAVGSGDRSDDKPPRQRSTKSGRTGKGHKKPMPLWQETILLLGLALILAIVIKSVFVQAFYIPSPSMEPQFVKNDRILVQKVSYWGSASPSRGDIIVFKDPGGWLDDSETSSTRSPVTRLLEKIGLYPAGGHLVKRVLATGGDRIVCCDADGRITVNGTALDETSYLPRGTAPSQVKFDTTIPEDHLWMMGDNREFSFDSRGHMGGPGGGFVDEDLVVGKVFSLIWPWDRAEIVNRPKSFETVPDAS
jgi:signal peptidase I